MFDTFAASERSCSREAVGGERLRSLLEQRVVESDMDGGEWSLFSCLEPRDAESLLLSAQIAAIEWDEGLVLDAEQRACMGESMSGFDWAALEDTEDPAAFGAPISGAVYCLPDLFLADMLDQLGISPDEPSAEQRACMQELISGFDWAALIALSVGLPSCLVDEGADDHANLYSGASTAAVGEPTGGRLDYDGDVDVFVFEAEQERFYEIHVTPGTLEDPPLELSDADGAFLAYNDDYGDSRASRLIWPAPASGNYHLTVGGYVIGSYTLSVTPVVITDDHADLQSGASTAAVGEATEGALDHVYDVDYFVFEAQQGQIYEIHVTLGTLTDSVLDLWDADGVRLDYNNDDYGDSRASRLIWPAPASGDYYVSVGGHGTWTGSYALAIGTAQATDDAST